MYICKCCWRCWSYLPHNLVLLLSRVHDYVGGVWIMHSGAMSSKIVADVTQSVLKSIPRRLQWESMHSPMCKHESTTHLWVVGPSCIPLRWSQENPLWWSQEHSPPSLRGLLLYSPVEVTGAQPPSSGGLLFVSTRGVSQAVYQPLPAYLLVVWEGMHVHEVD